MLTDKQFPFQLKTSYRSCMRGRVVGAELAPVFMGRFVPTRLINMVDEVAYNYPDVQLVICSESTLLPSVLHRYTGALALTQEFKTFFPQLAEKLKLPTLFCVASSVQTWEIYLAFQGKLLHLATLGCKNLVEPSELLAECADKSAAHTLREILGIESLGLDFILADENLISGIQFSCNLKEGEIRTLDSQAGAHDLTIRFDLRPYRHEHAAARRQVLFGLGMHDICQLEQKNEGSGQEKWYQARDVDTVLHLYNRALIEEKLYWPQDEEDPWQSCLEALTFSIREFLSSSGLTEVIIGLSGGMDSALIAALAVAALGPEHVHAYILPGPYTSDESLELSEELCRRLGLNLKCYPIMDAHEDIMEQLAGAPETLMEQNLQARLRSVILMGISSQIEHSCVLNTGNKSEAALGYSTLYGDSIGAFAPLCDLYKTEVYELARTFNRLAGQELIVQEIIDRAPSAELAPEQTDEKSFGLSYREFDAALESYLSDYQALSRGELSFEDFKVPDALKPRLQLIQRMKFKRKQEPFGPVVSQTSLSDFDTDNWPLTISLPDGLVESFG